MTQECPVCGQNFSFTHVCPGSPPARDMAAEWTPPEGFALWHYFRQALAVARFQDAAIVEASRDSRALLYGALIWTISNLLAFGPRIAAAVPPMEATRRWAAVGFGFAFLFLFNTILTLAQYATCHLLARWWFGARGSYIGILRAMSLGLVVMWLMPIPYVGMIVAGLWSIAVLMRVFEEVDKIGRIKAFGLAFVIGVIVQVFVFILFSHAR